MYGLDWNRKVDKTAIRMRIMGQLVNQYLFYRKPPDPFDIHQPYQDWNSMPDFEEWINDNEHHVLHKMGFRPVWVRDNDSVANVSTHTWHK